MAGVGTPQKTVTHASVYPTRIISYSQEGEPCSKEEELRGPRTDATRCVGPPFQIHYARLTYKSSRNEACPRDSNGNLESTESNLRFSLFFFFNLRNDSSLFRDGN